MTEAKGGNHPEQSQIRNQPLQPAWEAFGGRPPFPPETQSQHTSERVDTLQASRDTSGLPVSGRSRMDSQLGLGAGNRSETEHTATTRPLPGGVAGTPGRGGTTAEGGKDPRKVSRRKVLGWLAGLGATAAVGGGVGGFLAARSEGSTPTNPTPEATQPGGSVNTPTKEAPTITPTPTEVATATPTPTETSTPETPEGSRGNVASVEQLNIPDAQKEAINKMLEESTPMVIVEKEGQAFIYAISNKLLAKNEPFTCVDFNNTPQLCSVLKDVSVRPADDFAELKNFQTDAEKESFLNSFDSGTQGSRGLLEAKLQAWMAQTGSKLSFEEFLAARNSQRFGFQRRARNIFTGEVGLSTHDINSPVVIIYDDPGENINNIAHTVNLNQATALDPTEGSGVIGERIYFTDNGSLIGNRAAAAAVREDYVFDSTVAFAAAQWSDKANLNIIGAGLRSGHLATLSNTWKEITKHTVPIQNSDHWMGVSKIKGIPANGN